MALDFPNSPTDGQVYTDKATGEQWVYESATNSWTSKGLVNTSGGTSYKGSLDITAAPPAGVKSGWMYSALATGTANAGFSPGLTGTVTKGDLILFTGSEWTDTSHSVPDATAAVKGIDKKLWKKTGTALAPETAADTVQISAGTAALPGLTPVGDPNTGIYSPGADQVAISTNGTGRLFVDASGNVGVGITPAAYGHNSRLVLSGTGLTNSIFSNFNGVGNDKHFVLTNGGSALCYLGTDNRSFTFGVGNIERARITADGYLRLAGKGIQFNGDTADANSLDDYEEGTWAPVVTFGGNAVGLTGHFSGTYTKVGNLVTVFYKLIFTNKGTSTGGMLVSGLPFNSGGSNMSIAGLGYLHRLAAAQTSGQLYFAPSGATMVPRFVGYSAGNTLAFTDADIDNDTDIRGGVIYRV